MQKKGIQGWTRDIFLQLYIIVFVSWLHIDLFESKSLDDFDQLHPQIAVIKFINFVAFHTKIVSKFAQKIEIVKTFFKTTRHILRMVCECVFKESKYIYILFGNIFSIVEKFSNENNKDQLEKATRMS